MKYWFVPEVRPYPLLVVTEGVCLTDTPPVDTRLATIITLVDVMRW